MTTESTPDFETNWALFLDVDGTLLDLAEHPDNVKIPPTLIDILLVMQRTDRLPIALVSGRPIILLDRLFAPLHLPTAGQHGAERRRADGKIIRDQSSHTALMDVRENLRRIEQRNAGLFLEDKGLTLALHYRRAPHLQYEIENIVKSAIQNLDDDLVLVPGNMVLEIRSGRRDKGVAITEFMGEKPFSGRIPVFIGDDVTDEDGFARVNILDGYSIKVGMGSTAARWRLPNVSSVHDWLIQYAQWMESMKTS